MKITKDQINALLYKFEQRMKEFSADREKKVRENFKPNAAQKKILELNTKYLALRKQEEELDTQLKVLCKREDIYTYLYSGDDAVERQTSKFINEEVSRLPHMPNIRDIKNDLILSQMDASFDVENWMKQMEEKYLK